MRRHILFAIVLLIPACASESGGGGGSTTSSSSGTGGSAHGGSGGQATGAGGVGGSGAAPTGGTGPGGTGGTTTTTTGGCPAGAVICDGNTAQTCDGNGGFTSEQDCGGQICVPNLGCVDCIPGTGSCNGDVGTTCGDDGMSTEVHDCDPVQGMTCEPGTGECAGACSPESIGQSYVGCDYYPTVTANVVSNTFNFAVVVANTTPTMANITVTQGASTLTTTTVAAGDIQIVNLPWEANLKSAGASKLVVDGAYRVRADRPVAVYQYNPLEYQIGNASSYTNDASLLLPVNAWTSSYRIVARNHMGTAGLYAVTASQDGTTVTLAPSATGGTVNAGAGVAADGSGTLTLDAGDVLEVFSASAGGSPDSSDLTGTLVTADKPVQLIGGHGCTFVPYTTCCCDHLEEVIPPLETLGKEYIVTAPLIQGNPVSTIKGRMVRVVATAANTTIAYDPAQAGAPTALANAGDYFEIAATDQDFRITASEKVIVAQYMQGQQAGGNTGDPAMTIAVTTAQYRTDYLFHAPTNYEANYVNVVAPGGATVLLDGNPITGFTSIGGTGFDVARVQVSNAGNGNHSISSALPFGIDVYGYGQYTSFWYPGGLDLTPLGL